MMMCSCPACAAPNAGFSADDPSPDGSAAAASKPAFSLAQIITQLQTQWGGTGEGDYWSWSGANITYSMPSTSPSGTEASGFRPMSAMMQSTARLAFELWDDLVAVNLNEVSSTSANITFAYSSTTSGGGTYASWSGQVIDSTHNRMTSARIWLNSGWSTHDQDSDLYYGGYGIQTYLHEIGHALGLSHAGSYNAGGGGPITYSGSAEYAQDTGAYTVMSYFDADEDGSGTDHFGSDGRWAYASTPLVHDIAAIQAKYGADTTTRTGDTVYGFNSNAGRDVFDFARNPNPVIAIWDAGGVDTLDCSGFATNQTIDLAPGAFSSVGALARNVAVAFGATIENAVGGSGSDTIDGNAVSNWLMGGGGNDILRGGGGDDLLAGGPGADRIEGGAGSDTLDYRGATTGMTLVMGSTGPTSGQTFAGDPIGMDTFSDIEHVLCGEASDTVGCDGNGNYVAGNGGDDMIFGWTGTDLLEGGAGDDRLFGQQDDDRLDGGAGDDWLFGWAGNDELTGGAGADRFMWTGPGEGIDRILDYGYAAGDLLDVVGNPAQFTFYQAGADVMVLDPTGQPIFQIVNYALSSGLALV
jgi:serralysin